MFYNEIIEQNKISRYTKVFLMAVFLGSLKCLYESHLLQHIKGENWQKKRHLPSPCAPLLRSLVCHDKNKTPPAVIQRGALLTDNDDVRWTNHQLPFFFLDISFYNCINAPPAAAGQRCAVWLEEKHPKQIFFYKSKLFRAFWIDPIFV